MQRPLSHQKTCYDPAVTGEGIVATDGRAEARTDIAALSAGVVAVAVAMFVVPGPFDVIGVMIAITLALLIVGYVWDHPRDRRQSLAVAALLGIMAIPVVSFAVELALAPDRMLLLETGKLVACEDCEQESSVNHFWLVATWLVVGGAAFLTDRRSQP